MGQPYSEDDPNTYSEGNEKVKLSGNLLSVTCTIWCLELAANETHVQNHIQFLAGFDNMKSYLNIHDILKVKLS